MYNPLLKKLINMYLIHYWYITSSLELSIQLICFVVVSSSACASFQSLSVALKSRNIGSFSWWLYKRGSLGLEAGRPMGAQLLKKRHGVARTLLE
jgi:hypothetical protein